MSQVGCGQNPCPTTTLSLLVGKVSTGHNVTPNTSTRPWLAFRAVTSAETGLFVSRDTSSADLPQKLPIIAIIPDCAPAFKISGQFRHPYCSGEPIGVPIFGIRRGGGSASSSRSSRVIISVVHPASHKPLLNRLATTYASVSSPLQARSLSF
jgi:hypothetical protein